MTHRKEGKKINKQTGTLTYFLAALLSSVVHDDGRVDEGAGGRHILSQQAFHFVRTQADWQIEELHRSIGGIICAGMSETSGLFEPLMQNTAGSRCFLFINARHLHVTQHWIKGYKVGETNDGKRTWCICSLHRNPRVARRLLGVMSSA